LTPQAAAASRHTRTLGLATLAYAAFVVYGSLVPLDFHYRPLMAAWDAFLQTPYLHLGLGSRADWVANILLYIPLGFLATGWLAAGWRSRGFAAGVVVFVLCVLLAVGVEFTQLYFPPRTVSLNDIVAEIIGSALGIALWLSTGERVVTLWAEVQLGGPASGRALTVLYTAAYLGFALFPFDFLVSRAELAAKLADSGRSSLFVTQLCGGTLHCSAKLLSEVLTAAPLGVFLGMVAGRRLDLGRAFVWGLLLGAVIEGLQAFLASGISQGASVLTRGIGVTLGLMAYRTFNKEWLARYRAQIKTAVLLALPFYLFLLLALTGLFAARLESYWIAVAKLHQVRFLPFYYHYFSSETQAMYSLLLHVGAYAPIGLAVWILGGGRGGRTLLWLSGLAAAATASAMETLKLFLNGKRPDPTDVLIAAAAAMAAYVVATRLTRLPTVPVGPGIRSAQIPPQPEPPLKSARVYGLGLTGGVLLGVVALIGWVIAVQPKEHFVDERRLPQLPAPEQLPPVDLPGFKSVHPRLPAPTAAELRTLAMQNPEFLQQVRSRANGGKGEIEAAALQELIEPGSVDLSLVHRRLLELEITRRGDEQVKPLTVAYDWLYARWSESQRTELRAKLADGCEYIIALIRKDRMSPYNVILYNAPLQALMACSLALYGDDPRGDPIMRFASDMWKNRVLPAWRQVMGHNGGWHEGGEYVGIGIGQAIYELPAMWRSATGEDLFVSEPGIRGFLDFLVYRKRPDGTDFRWGDGSVFDRIALDTIPLALEFRHAPAYRLHPPTRDGAPSGWPWGPLTDRGLDDPASFARLPLVRLFDGIGMLVARSDWSPDATYITFKAGDNYWSHMHLDQGAFTIYKGGELAIDSGFYGPSYGSDHHMNYTYQSIAHNVVTVTDPQDTVPAPGKDKPRPIANDGGQRRIGSGWGVEPAPLDRREWEAKRDIYHTAAMGPLLDQGGLVVAAADITPAYTNRRSGDGTFSARTRRVERFWRIFGYDRVDDVVVVFDQVTATTASFRKRWLLHTIEAPTVSPGAFSVTVAPQDRPGHAGGRLDGKILLPKDAVINAIGGRGFEFFVDDRNYDENGTLRELVGKLGPNNGEPGAWRIEVSPPRDARQDMFLVVLLPTAGAVHSVHRVRLLESGKRVGCEIVGPIRTTRWWFEAGRNDAEVEVSSGSDAHSYVVGGPEAQASSTSDWASPIRRLFGR
jgi:VanZ family protein